MINFLHNFTPQPILFSIGQIHIYWYGLFMVTGIIIALIINLKLAEYYNINKEIIYDLSFWLIIWGVIGARIYDVILELPYYANNPLNVFKIWQGGLAIHGAIIAGLLTVYFYCKKLDVNFWKITSIIVPGLALAQAIGRWGNYFNQELFGKPTSLPWGIPIEILNRPIDHMGNQFFHPTFLYESLGNFAIFIILISIHLLVIKRRTSEKINNHYTLTLLYLVLYSILRFSLEFIRIDYTPTFFNLRTPQIISSIIIIACIILLIRLFSKKALKNY